MRAREIIKEFGLIVPGVNATVDVQPGEITRQGAKMGFKLDANGLPPLLMPGAVTHTNAKDTSTTHATKDQTFYGQDGTPPNKSAPGVK
jgi:hypothetical protein